MKFRQMSAQPSLRNASWISAPRSWRTFGRLKTLSPCNLAGRFRGRPSGRLMGVMASIFSSIVVSLTFAAVKRIVSGTPSLLTTRCHFVPCLPRSVGFFPVSRPPRERAPSRHRSRLLSSQRSGFAKSIQKDLMEAISRHQQPASRAAPAGHPRATAHLRRQHLPGMSVISTNRMPVRTARSGMGGRPLGRAFWIGSNGSMALQSSSDTIGLAITPSLSTLRGFV